MPQQAPRRGIGVDGGWAKCGSGGSRSLTWTGALKPISDEGMGGSPGFCCRHAPDLACCVLCPHATRAPAQAPAPAPSPAPSASESKRNLVGAAVAACLKRPYQSAGRAPLYQGQLSAQFCSCCCLRAAAACPDSLARVTRYRASAPAARIYPELLPPTRALLLFLLSPAAPITAPNCSKLSRVSGSSHTLGTWPQRGP
jgi:hypothetical protein